MFQLTWVGVSWGDIIAGALHLIVDLFIQFGLNRGLARFGDWISGRIAGVLASRVAVMGVRLSSIGVKTLGQLIQAVTQGKRVGLFLGYGLADQAAGIFAGLALGTPVGYSPAKAPTSRVEGFLDQGEGALAEAIDNMLNSPLIEQHPSAPNRP
jgi:hypothetical protein